MLRLSCKIFSVLFLVLTLSQCVYYTPNAHNVPLLKNKGDLRLMGGFQSGVLEDNKGVDFQTAYAITDSMGIMLNGNYSWGNNSYDDASGYLIEGGAGYFTSLSERWSFEGFAGFGHGTEQHTYTGGDANIRFTRFFLQPALGYKRTYFEAALSARLCHLYFYHYDPSNFAALDPEVQDDLNYLEGHRSSFLFEPALTLRVGPPDVKLQLQVGSSVNINNRDLDQNNGFGLIGVIVDLDKIFKSK